MKAGWDEKSLGETCDVLDRLRKPITKKDRIEGPVPYYGATGIVDYVEGHIFDELLVLVGEDGAKWGAGDNTAFEISGKTWVNNHAHVLRPYRDEVLDQWLIYFLNFSDLSEYITGVTVPKLNQKKLRSIPIPIPPLDEQKRIVAVLDEAFEGLDRARAHTETNLQNARDLFESVMKGTFEKMEGKNDHVVLVEELAKSEKGSMRTGPFGSDLLHREFTESGVCVLGIDNAVKNEFSWGRRRYISEQKYEELKRYRVKPKDVIITIMGTCGRCAVIPDDIPLSINSKHLCCITLDQKRCDPDYLHCYFLHSPTALDYLERNASGAVMAGLNMGLIRKLPVHAPALPEQSAIVSAFKTAMQSNKELELAYKAKLTDLDDLRQSLLQKAFAGKLT